MALRNRGLLGGHLSRKPCMKVYDSKALQALLGISDNTARRIMQEYGFRTGYKPRSPLRITEEGVMEWLKRQMNTASPRTQ